jgi:hypothetical protein
MPLRLSLWHWIRPRHSGGRGFHDRSPVYIGRNIVRRGPFSYRIRSRAASNWYDRRHLMVLTVSRFHITARGFDQVLQATRELTDLDVSDSLSSLHIVKTLSKGDIPPKDATPYRRTKACKYHECEQWLDTRKDQNLFRFKSIQCKILRFYLMLCSPKVTPASL